MTTPPTTRTSIFDRIRHASTIGARAVAFQLPEPVTVHIDRAGIEIQVRTYADLTLWGEHIGGRVIRHGSSYVADGRRAMTGVTAWFEDGGAA